MSGLEELSREELIGLVRDQAATIAQLREANTALREVNAALEERVPVSRPSVKSPVIGGARMRSVA